MQISSESVKVGHPDIVADMIAANIIATILDEIAGRSQMGDPSVPRFMFTGKLEVKYRKNAPIGRPLRIVGKAGKVKGRAAEAWAGMYAEDGSLLAEATTVLFDVPQETLDSTDLNALGWKIYPE